MRLHFATAPLLLQEDRKKTLELCLRLFTENVLSYGADYIT